MHADFIADGGRIASKKSPALLTGNPRYKPPLRRRRLNFSMTITGLWLGVVVMIIACIMTQPKKVATLEDDITEWRYGVIVDCGSSGTRANLFHWNSAFIYPAFLNEIEPLREKGTKKALSRKKTPGLSSMKGKPTKANEYMQEIVDFIKEHIPADAQSDTGVYIMATAGMRLLEQETQRQIMSDIAKDLGTNYNFAKVSAEVITGAQEGMFQWISVNSKASRFKPTIMGPTEERVTKTYALIEMGGASIQVAYELHDDLGRRLQPKLDQLGIDFDYKSQIVEPSISQDTKGFKCEIHSTTFLGLGSNSARENYLDMLIKRELTKPTKRIDDRFNRFLNRFSKNKGELKSTRPVELKDPCLPKDSSEVVQKPKRMKKEKKTIGFIADEDEEMFTVNVVGSGDYKACRKQVSNFLKLCKSESLHCKPEEPCTMKLLGTPFVPFPEYEFLGLGEFYYSTSSMMELGGKYNHEAIFTKTKEMCELSIGELEKKYPEANKFDKDRSRTECFKAVFVDTFLIEGLMMPPNFDKLKTVSSIEGEPVDWTLGAVLDKALAIELSADDMGDDRDELNDDDEDDDYDYNDLVKEEEEEEEAENEKNGESDNLLIHQLHNHYLAPHEEEPLYHSANGAGRDEIEEEEEEEVELE